MTRSLIQTLTALCLVFGLAIPAAAGKSPKPQPGKSPKLQPSATGIKSPPPAYVPELPLVILYDQTDNPTANATTSQNFEAAYNAYDNQGADDFLIPPGSNWSIEQVFISGFYSAAGPIVSMNITFYADAGGLPGALEFSALNVVPTSGGVSPIVDLVPPAVLTPGIHWMSAQANMNFNPSGQWYWYNRSVQSNSAAAWQNPGGGFGTPCATWGTRNSTCGIAPGEPDQIYSLSGTTGPPTPAISFVSSTMVAESCVPANAAIDPGETVTMNFELQNVGGADTSTNLVATLLATGGVTAPSGPQDYGVLVAGGPSVSRSFTFTADPLAACGSILTATLDFQDGATNLGTDSISSPLGVLGAPVTTNYSSGAIAIPIPDVTITDIPMVIPDTGVVTDIDVRIRLNHTWDSDLDISLIGPDGTTVDLSSDNGGSGDNYGSGATDCTGTFTIFDDEAATPITAGVVPFNGPFQPEGLLSAFDGRASDGTWTLRIGDDVGGDTGTLFCFQLDIGIAQYSCCFTPPGSTDLGVVKTDSPDPVAPGGTLTYTVTATNAGPDNSSAVTVIDTLPAGVAFLSATPSQGVCNEATGIVTCGLGAMLNGGSATMIIMVTAPAVPGLLSNVVSISGAEADPNAVNNNDTEDTTVADPCAGEIDPPVVTAPAPITVDATICVGNQEGATGATSSPLAAFIVGGSATDICDATPTQLPSQVGGFDIDNTTFFPVGATTVTFRFQDDAGNIGTATADVTVALFYGDLNQDTFINAADSVILANFLVGNLTQGPAPFTAPLGAADLNNAGGVDAVDSVIMANYLVGNITCLPQ